MTPNTNQLQHKWPLTQTCYNTNDPLHKPATTQMTPYTNQLQHKWPITQTCYNTNDPLHKPASTQMSAVAQSLIWGPSCLSPELLRSYIPVTFRAFSRHFNPKRFSPFVKKNKQYVAVGTVRMFIETSAKHFLTHSPYTTKTAWIRCYTMLSTMY